MKKKSVLFPTGGILLRGIGLGLLSAVFLWACGTKSADAQLDFQYSRERGTIVCKEIEYYRYGIPQKADMTEQIGILEHEADDKIFSYQDYAREDFIISYLETGLMDNPVLYRAADCDIEPEGVAVFEEDGSGPDIIWLFDDVVKEDVENSGYFAGGYSYRNYFEVEDMERSIVYIVLSNAESMALEKVQSGLDGKQDVAEMAVAGYYRKQE